MFIYFVKVCAIVLSKPVIQLLEKYSGRIDPSIATDKAKHNSYQHIQFS